MAEAIGLISGTIGIATAVIKTIAVIQDQVRVIKDGSRSLERLAEELSALAVVVTYVEDIPGFNISLNASDESSVEQLHLETESAHSRIAPTVRALESCQEGLASLQEKLTALDISSNEGRKSSPYWIQARTKEQGLGTTRTQPGKKEDDSWPFTFHCGNEVGFLRTSLWTYILTQSARSIIREVGANLHQPGPHRDTPTFATNHHHYGTDVPDPLIRRLTWRDTALKRFNNTPDSMAIPLTTAIRSMGESLRLLIDEKLATVAAEFKHDARMSSTAIEA